MSGREKPDAPGLWRDANEKTVVACMESGELAIRDADTGEILSCVCSIESGPCERVDVFHVSGRFWSTSACGEKRTPARPAWTSFPS